MRERRCLPFPDAYQLLSGSVCSLQTGSNFHSVKTHTCLTAQHLKVADRGC
jgi:hypothetical protein